MNPRTWWYVARASGLVAWALAAASVVWGLAVSTRLTSRRPPRGWLLDLHRFLGGLTVSFTAVHVAALVADDYVHFGVADLLVPLASRWHPVPVAFGVVALYLLVAIELTSLAMRRLPRRLWRAVHASSWLLFVLATVHLATAGTDRRSPAVQWLVLVATTAVGFLTLVRVWARRRSPRRHAVPRGA